MESENIEPLDALHPFCFACHSGVPCFNECCRDLNQFLTPYDVVRLKAHFKLSSAEFLAAYTTRHIGPQTGLPVVTITPADRFTRMCPFVTAAGCRVYQNRPSSCRMYPLIRVVRRARADGGKTIQYALLHEPHCKGFDQPRQLTAEEWMDSQGLGLYNQYNDLMMDIISLKNQYMPSPLTGSAQKLFYTLLYDIDALKDDSSPPELAGVDIPAAQRKDDAALLEGCMDYLKTYITARQPE